MGVPELIDTHGMPLRANYVRESGNDGAATAYKGASLATQETYAWRPPYTSGESETLYERVLAGSRARDLVRNDPHALSGTNVLVDMLVGAGLQWAPSPDAYALGLDPRKEGDRKKLRVLARALKSEWALFAGDPRKLNDAQRRLTLNGQLRLMCRTWVTLNEATGFLTWKKGQGRYATCLRVVDPDRLSNPMGQADTLRLRAGIEYDADGVPLAYHVRNGHPADWFRYAQLLQWQRIPARTAWGRPVFIHAFEAEREDQSRGITPLISAMSRLRMIGKFADTELASATVNALFAAFVYSNLPVDELTQSFTPGATTWMDKHLEYLAKNPVHLNGVRIPTLPPGAEVKMNGTPRQTPAFKQFQTAFLQSAAASRGVSYEQMSMDWSAVNYSSARAALNEVWRSVTRKLAQFTDQAVMPILYAVIEEAFDRGYIKPLKGAPDFWDAPGAYLSGRWIGPARGYVDPEKEAQAATVRMGAFTSTLQKECADAGTDWEDNLIQAVEEKETLDAFGLERAESATGRIVPDASDAPASGRDAKNNQAEQA
jgi:lambda family phage portal protein